MSTPIANIVIYEDDGGICARMTDDAGMDIEGFGDDAVGALKDLIFALEKFIGGAYDAPASVSGDIHD